MIKLKRGKRSRSKNILFNPYTNGISTYDMTYLSSKKGKNINKTIHITSDLKKNNLAA